MHQRSNDSADPKRPPRQRHPSDDADGPEEPITVDEPTSDDPSEQPNDQTWESL